MVRIISLIAITLIISFNSYGGYNEVQFTMKAKTLGVGFEFLGGIF